ncbi:MAG: hypothetical protein KAI95_22495, partial [Bacteroidales bacterium]|nr:hypothetical protein [Bacteroidales bacterium]
AGSTNLNIPSKEAVMLVIYPSGTLITTSGKKTYAGDVIIDYNNESIVSDHPPRIKALEAEKTIIKTGTSTQVYCTASDPGQEALTYEWTVEGATMTGTDIYQFLPTDSLGIYQVACKITDPGLQWDTLSVWVEVVEKVVSPPEILKIEADPGKVHLSGTIELTCIAQDANMDSLTYKWTAGSGSLIADNNHATFTAPDTEGNYFIVCTVSDTDEMTDTDSTGVMVRDLSVLPTGNLIALYPLNGNAEDASGNGLHGTPGGVSWVSDKDGAPNNAAQFDGTNDFIHVPNDDKLNFQDALSIACWIKIDQFFAREQHPVSHGSWQNRYKISIGDQHIRFTVNTSDAIKDLDSKTVPVAGQGYHLAVIYNGTDMEIWLDGKLDAFTSHAGLINKTAYDLAFGQNLPGVNDYNFKGALDAVSIFDYGLFPDQIKDHMENSINLSIPGSAIRASKRISVFPNPVTGPDINIRIYSKQPEDITLTLYELSGKQAGVKKDFRTAAEESTTTMPAGML